VAVITNKSIPRSLQRIVDSYFNDRKLKYITRGEERTITLTNGVPQSSVLGTTMWNLLYDGLLRETMPTGFEVLAFADDLALVVTAKHTREVEELLEAAAEITLVARRGWPRGSNRKIKDYIVNKS